MSGRSGSPVLSNDSTKIQASSPNMSSEITEKVPLVVVNDKPVENDNDTNTDLNSLTSDTKNNPDESIRRAIPDGGSEIPEGNDERRKSLQPHYPGSFYTPSIRHDLEIGSILPDGETIPDVNVYQHKKTLAQGMMDLALFSANANQLRYVLESSNRHPYFYPSLIFISVSLIFQVAVGIGLTWNAIYNVKDDKEICIANKINNFTIIGIFIITVVNVFISAFGVAGPVPITST